MKTIHICFILITAFLINSCSDSHSVSSTTPPNEVNEFLKGTDISFLPEIEDSGYVYYNANNEPQDALSILKQNGMNVVRLRLWKNPTSIRSSFNEVKALSQRAKNAGLKVWLTVHYSDTWADPGKQFKPEQWENISFEALKDSVYAYTKKIVTEINPEYIQIGNEINPGFIFPEGNRNSNPTQFKALLSEGLQAVREHSNSKTMIHFAGYSNAYSFFNSLSDLDYDIIALSYYPTWHGKDLNSLRNIMTSLKTDLQKEIVIAEVAYPFTLEWNDWTNNIIGLENQLIPDFPATPQGQKEFLEAINQICIDTESIGFCYWAPEWTAYRGNQATNGSNWENQTLFDFDGKILPAVAAFND